MRDWIDLWVTPFNENLQLPLEDWLPDLQGPPKDSVHIRMDTWARTPTNRTSAVRSITASRPARPKFPGKMT